MPLERSINAVRLQFRLHWNDARTWSQTHENHSSECYLFMLCSLSLLISSEFSYVSICFTPPSSILFFFSFVLPVSFLQFRYNLCFFSVFALILLGIEDKLANIFECIKNNKCPGNECRQYFSVASHALAYST